MTLQLQLVLLSTGLLGGLGIAFGVVLAVASRRFATQEDPLVQQLIDALPGKNCGACGHPSCAAFAEALANGTGEIDGCHTGGSDTAANVAQILGREAPAVDPAKRLVAVVHCCGGTAEQKETAAYQGLRNCKAAAGLAPTKKCTYGCIGFGDCADVCPSGALHMGTNGLPEVDLEKCTACGLCVPACPRGLLRLAPARRHSHIECSSHDIAKETMGNCTVGCIACGLCVGTCPTKAISLSDNLAIIDSLKCTDCGKCVSVCPRTTIKKR